MIASVGPVGRNRGNMEVKTASRHQPDGWWVNVPEPAKSSIRGISPMRLGVETPAPDADGDLRIHSLYGLCLMKAAPSDGRCNFSRHVSFQVTDSAL